MIRATVTLVDHSTEAEGATYDEWGHQHEIELDQFGVLIHHGRDARTFYPWPSVVRIEFAPCRCIRCAERPAA